MVHFRPTLYIQHLEGQHYSKWAEYQALAAAEKESIFKSVIHVVNTLCSHFDGSGDQLFIDIDAPIVDTIIRKLLFDPDANNAAVKSALLMFKPMHSAAGDENVLTHYHVHIKNMKLFKLAVGQVPFGCSFRVASRQISLARRALS
jgi:hypothetical protein